MNLRSFVASLAALATVALISGEVRAEVLQVGGTYPAGVDAAASVRRLAVMPFGGREGEVLSFAIEDRLRGVAIAGQPWFQVLPEGGGADAVLRGMASLEWTTSKVKQQRDMCIEEDGDGKCKRKEKREVECTAIDYRLVPQLRLIAMDGRLLHSDGEAESRSVTECPRDKDVVSRREIVRDLAGRIAARVRSDLAPEERSESVRVLEKRDGLSKEDGELFKNALRLTKSDAAAACRQWQSIAGTNPGQVSTAFNLALCAESVGDDRTARDRYEALLRGANVYQARDRLGQIEARERGRRQLAAHERG